MNRDLSFKDIEYLKNLVDSKRDSLGREKRYSVDDRSKGKRIKKIEEEILYLGELRKAVININKNGRYK